jgi:glycosyltransferase involved in cell wall biosynthesis
MPVNKGSIGVRMATDKPRLSIGLPVFNGEKYLEETIKSLLGQSFVDFELIISDNASIDGTQDICQAYASRDRRIKYYRNAENIGATQNWYRVFDLSSSEYFASAAHDDLYAPDYMEKCISVLDRDSSIVVCSSKPELLMSVVVHWTTIESRKCWRQKLTPSRPVRQCDSTM